MKKIGFNKKYLVFIMFVVFIVGAFHMSMYYFGYPQKTSINPNLEHVMNLRGDVQYRLGDLFKDAQEIPADLLAPERESAWQNFKALGGPRDLEYHKDIWLRIKLPDVQVKDPSIFFAVNDQIFDVYFEGQHIYGYGNRGKGDKTQSPGSPWHIISLPDDFQNKYLIIAMHSDFSRNTGIIRRMELGSTGSHIVRMVRQDLDNIILAGLFIFIGLCTTIFFMMEKIERKSFFFLGFASACTGVWIISESYLKQLLFNAPRFWYYTAIASFYLMPVGFLIFISQVFANNRNRYIKALYKIHLAFAAVALFLDAFNILLAPHTLIFYYSLLTISIVSLIVTVVKSSEKNNTNSRIFTIGLATLGFYGLYDIIGFYFHLIPWTRSLTHWGMFVFVLSLLFIVVQFFIDIRNKVETYSLEIKNKNERLIEKKKLLDEALVYDKLKTEFFANISHELRTPLNIILTTIQLLDIYKSNGAIAAGEMNMDKYLKMMRQNCYRLIKLVNNLIDITKIDSGYLKPVMENHNVVSIIEEITGSVSDYIRSKGKTLVFDTDTEEKIIRCDPDKIERIMLNLLSNAVKFTNPGAFIYVNIHDAGGSIVISIEDTGIGIPEDKVDTIFERFVQVDKSLTRNHEGSGIGLSLVHALVEMHEGAITVESQYGKGTRFTIELPAKGAAKAEPQSSSVMRQNHVEKVSIEFSDIYIDYDKDSINRSKTSDI